MRLLISFTNLSVARSQIDIMTGFRLLLTHSLFISLWVQTLIPDLSIKKKLTIHKLSSSLRLNASVYTSQTQVCTQRNAALLCPHSSLRNQAWHSGVNDAVPSSPSPTSLLLPSQYTNTTPRPAVWCGNSVHISCQPERFLGLIHVLPGWSEGVTPRPVSPRSKSLSGSEK